MLVIPSVLHCLASMSYIFPTMLGDRKCHRCDLTETVLIWVLHAWHLLITGKTQDIHMEGPEAQEISELLCRPFDGLVHLSTIRGRCRSGDEPKDMTQYDHTVLVMGKTFAKQHLTELLVMMAK